MIFSYFKHNFIFFNVNEQLAVPCVELARGESCVGYLDFFCLHWITCMSIYRLTQALLILPIAQNPLLLTFCFCLYG